MSLLLTLEQMVERLRDIHDRGVIHRDIKPENFVFKDLPMVEEEASDSSASQQYETDLPQIIEEDNEESPSPNTSIQERDLFSTKKTKELELFEPANRCATLYLIDYGLSTFYTDP